MNKQVFEAVKSGAVGAVVDMKGDSVPARVGTGALDRVRKFLDERARVRGIDPAEIAGLHAGDDTRAASLLTRDLRGMLALADAAWAVVEAYDQRFGNTRSGSYVGPIDEEIAALQLHFSAEPSAKD